MWNQRKKEERECVRKVFEEAMHCLSNSSPKFSERPQFKTPVSSQNPQAYKYEEHHAQAHDIETEKCKDKEKYVKQLEE